MPDVVILFFLLGLLARVAGSPLKLPQPLYESLSIYLLLAIGLKGGMELARQPVAQVLPEAAACVALGFAIPFAVVPLLRMLGFNRFDSASLAAHYGSVSVVTFAVATAYLERAGIAHEAHASLWLALMEAPALLSAVLLARGLPRGDPGAWKHLAGEVFTGASVVLLVGGLAVGAFMGERGSAAIAPVFVDPFKGMLCLFMLELGRVVAERLGDVRRFGLRLLAIGVGLPPVLALGGAATGVLLGLSPGGIAVLATLAGSASYIAAPTAMRIALPESNAALAITAALAISFPFNLLVGIPLYARMASLAS
ncbi:MAG TPA: sodium-dependent bicarbonate transport family permease [Ramlibacter sp.]